MGGGLTLSKKETSKGKIGGGTSYNSSNGGKKFQQIVGNLKSNMPTLKKGTLATSSTVAFTRPSQIDSN